MNIITGKNLISNTVAQIRANMNVVHNILNTKTSIKHSQEAVLMAA